MSLFDNKEEIKNDKQPMPKPQSKSGKAKVVNIVKDKKGNILHFIVDVNGNGQKVMYNEKFHKDVKLNDEIVI